MDNVVLRAESLTKIYRRGVEEVRALDGVTFSIEEGEFVSIVGQSGSGKTTLLNLIGCMDTPTSGTIEIDGHETSRLSDRQSTRLRSEKIGFVFQHFGLIPTLSVEENIMLPTLFARRAAKGKASELLEQVGLSHRHKHRPHELSGGEMQRVAIARALINSPALLLADEPTGNLDSTNGEAILRLFTDLNRAGLTIIVVTHNPALADAAHRQLNLQDGHLLLESQL
ncbi:MAG: ABC transporter ATP-binding protein [Chthonomonadaceae bacterium]|nr:ABC transporter ATP-binding protein [Chthonomonadaceae bacterium]